MNHVFAFVYWDANNINKAYIYFGGFWQILCSDAVYKGWDCITDYADNSVDSAMKVHGKKVLSQEISIHIYF